MLNITLSKLLPDPEDPRDYLFEVEPAVLPMEVDLRLETSPIEDQGNEGSCTANATVGAAEAFLLQAAGRFIDLSRNFNYYTSRELLGQEYLKEDKGSTIRMALRAANKLGIPTEATWPYTAATLSQKPSDVAYAEAQNYKLGAYYRIRTINDPNPTPNLTTQSAIVGIKYALAMGYPVVSSFRVGAKLLTLPKDHVYMNIGGDNPEIGGHALLIVGYKWLTGNLVFIVRNSWGRDWCDDGYFLMHPNVVSCDAIDLWVPKNFAGIDAIGPNLVIESPPMPVISPPTSASTIKDVVTYVFQRDFGRSPKQAGLDFWTGKILEHIEPAIIAAASPADKAYMAAHGV